MSKKRTATFWSAWVICAWSHAQPPDGLFLPCAQGFASNDVACFYNDTIDDRLYIGGSFLGLSDDSEFSPGIFFWDGSELHAVGCGFEWDCVTPLSVNGIVPPVRAITRWNDEIYAAGYFTSANGVETNHIARWDGSAWQSVGGGMDGTVFSLKAYPDGLYASGWYNHAGSIEAHGLARWDGSDWHTVHDLPILVESWGINNLNDMTYYQDHVYIGGNFGGGNGRNDIAYFNGTEWVGCGNGITGGTSGVYELQEHDGLLYVAGYLADWLPYGSPNNPGSGVATWDGDQWGGLGACTRYSSNPSVFDMVWLHDTLYISGLFNMIDGVSTDRLARWDGNEWCSLVPYGYTI